MLYFHAQMQPIKTYHLANEKLRLTVLDHGAIIQRLEVKDQTGNFINVVRGFETPEAYRTDTKSFGACVGPFAGRIAGGRCAVEGKQIRLDSEEGVHLHGGKAAWGRRFWHVHTVEADAITLTLTCPHDENGYPGNVAASVTYRLQDNELHIVHQATTDRPTLLNMTNHSYFDLSGKGDIDAQRLQVKADRYLEVDDTLLPTGKLLPVEGTTYDFRKEQKIGATGMDDTFVFDGVEGEVISLFSKSTGLRMQVMTNQPAAVIFTPPDRTSICFETQNFPDAPNHQHFPSAVLRPGATYGNHSIFRFSN